MEPRQPTTIEDASDSELMNSTSNVEQSQATKFVTGFKQNGNS